MLAHKTTKKGPTIPEILLQLVENFDADLDDVSHHLLGWVFFDIVSCQASRSLTYMFWMTTWSYLSSQARQTSSGMVDG